MEKWKKENTSDQKMLETARSRERQRESPLEKEKAFVTLEFLVKPVH